jgi:(1->4)-alpha-D-glucan 1-alpha-D-glucosylmutase
VTDVPRATYRLQFRGAMTLDGAAALAPYLRALGISHLYASPLTRAAPESTHGYDVADFNVIEPAIGGDAGLETLVAALRQEGLGLILDFVPNHMGATPHSPWWRSILEWGPESDHAEHFDIDWSAPKLIVPVLGEPYGEALDNGKFGLCFDRSDGGVSFTYGGLRLPLSPPTYARILARIERDPFPDLARRFAVARPETSDATKEDLARLVADASIAETVERVVAEVAADTTLLHDLHEAQVWRASYWRAARERLTYRRFFEIADLVGVRVERQRVFDDVHALLLRLVGEGALQGIRLDHIDGLADPKSYLDRLQAAIRSEQPFYLLVEKILGPGERLRRSWPVAGTTGYEFITALAGVFVASEGKAALDAAYTEFIGGPVDYAAMVEETKRRILSRNLAGELDYLKDMAARLADRDRATRDYGADSLRRAILELAAAMPVYRTYVSVEGPSEEDRAIIDAAAARVREGREVEDPGAVAFIARVLALDFPDPDMQAGALDFVHRFQQTTGPVMAKALEDTVFYRYNRLIALNEVGGEPEHFGAPLEAFHDAMAMRLADQPNGLSATATHDTKRGEDARARLYAVSEMPEAWAAASAAWHAQLHGLLGEADGAVAPEPVMEWLFYQALAGAWPADLDAGDGQGREALAERLDAFMIKAVREAKIRTSWAAPAPDYEKAVSAFVRGAFADDAFLADFAKTCRPLFLAGAVNALSQLAIKLCAPGVPDIYQGTELWDLSLVDPDNRRPVDFDACAAALRHAESAEPSALLADWRSGAAKARLLAAGLRLRGDRPDLFAAGEYRPLDVEGAERDRVLAFARVSPKAGCAIVVAPRLVLPLLDGGEGGTNPLVPAGAWKDTAVVLPEALRGHYRDVVTGHVSEAADRLRLATVLGAFPTAVLVPI